MKKYLIAFTLILPLAASAQIQTGNLFVGGSVNTYGDTQNLDGYSTVERSYAFEPRVGFVLSPSFSVGLGVNYSNGKIYQKYPTQPDYTTDKNWSVSVVPFVRYYIPISETFYFALNGAVSVGKGRVIQSYDGTVIYKTTNTGATITPMLLFFPSSHWSIEATLSALYLTHGTQKQEYDGAIATKKNDFGFNAGQISLGLSYYFNK